MVRDLLAELAPTFTLAEATSAGLTKHAVYRYRDGGIVVEISRGVYRVVTAPELAQLDALAVAKRAPRGILCLITALDLHDLTDEIPDAVDVAVRAGTKPPSIQYPPVRVHRLRAETFDLERTELELAPDESVPVYSPERTVVDALRLKHLVGESVALTAAKRYLARRSAQPWLLAEIARKLGAGRRVFDTLRVLGA
jgi:predicted transcriptional regulator of viral defense system